MSILEGLNKLILPSRRPNESPEERLAHDAVDRFLMGSVKAKAIDDVTTLGLKKIGDAFSDEDELDEEMKRLRIEQMRRSLGKYRDDDGYEQEVNREGPLIPKSLLVAHNLQRYAQRGKSLVDLLLGEPHDGLIRRLAIRR